MGVLDSLWRLQGEREVWLSLLAEMVNIDSGPEDAEGADRMVQLLSSAWSERRCSVEVLSGDCPTMLIRRPGTGLRILMLGHYDTVFPEGTARRRPFRVEAGKGMGPGAADMKSGLVAQLACVSLMDPAECDLTVVINGDEESGSVASRHAIVEQASRADLALVFEPADPDGAIVVGRPGVRRFLISTHGRAAHSGVEPEKGRNAIEGIAHLVLAAQELGKRGDFGTVTVSQVSGGTRPNIVPAQASMVVDARVPTESAGQALTAALETLVAQVMVEGVAGQLERLDDRPAFSPSAESDRVARLIHQIGAEAGFVIEAKQAGGSSDGNFTSAAGVPTIDGLGPPGGGFHTEEEWFDIQGLFQRAALVAELLVELSPSEN